LAIIVTQASIGYKGVLRQRPIDNYIVDFFCPEIKLIIEIDGNSHFTKGDYDRKRADKLESLGYRMIRFTEGEVLNQLDSVILSLQHAIDCLKNECRTQL
jgi:very-short-patch-repair endonuclease